MIDYSFEQKGIYIFKACVTCESTSGQWNDTTCCKSFSVKIGGGVIAVTNDGVLTPVKP